MRGGVCAVEADADAGYAALFDLTGNLGVDQRAVGRQGYDEAGVGGMACDVEDVGAKKRFAAGEDKDPAREAAISSMSLNLRRFSGLAASGWSATVMP